MDEKQLIDDVDEIEVMLYIDNMLYIYEQDILRII